MNEYEIEVKKKLAEMPSGEIQVTDALSFQQAGYLLVEIAKYKKFVKEKFESPKKAAKKAHEEICGLEKEALAEVTARENEIRQKMTAYQEAEQARIRAEQERRRKEAEELARLAQEAEEAGDTETAQEFVAVAALEESNVTAAPKAAGVSFREVWRAKVIDPAKIPREYLIINQSALDAVARATKGQIAIPGVEFVKETVSSVRTR